VNVVHFVDFCFFRALKTPENAKNVPSANNFFFKEKFQILTKNRKIILG